MVPETDENSLLNDEIELNNYGSVAPNNFSYHKNQLKEWLNSHSRGMSVYTALCMMIVNFIDRVLRFSIFSIPTSYWSNKNMKEFLGVATSLSMCLGMFFGIWCVNRVSEKNRNMLLLFSMLVLCWLPSLTFIFDIEWIIILGKFFGTLPEGIFAGILVTHLEGRKKTDIYTGAYYLGSMLGRPASNSIGTYLATVVDIKWVPLAISIIFFVPLLIVTLLITIIPKPNSDDMVNKSTRKINMDDAKYFWKYFFIGIVGVVFVSGTTFGWRTYRDYFTPEIYSQELGGNPQPWVYFVTDIPGAIIPLIMFIYLNKIKSNMFAFMSLSFYILVSVIIACIVCWLAVYDVINPYVFLVLTAASSYMLIPTIFPTFDRLIAASKAEISTLFLKNLSDGINNLFATIILIIVLFIPIDLQLEVYEWFGAIISNVNIVVFIIAIIFFSIRIKSYNRELL